MYVAQKLFFTVPEAADFLGVSERAVYQRIYKKTMPFKKWGGSIVIPCQELKDFLAKLPGVSVDEAIANVENTIETVEEVRRLYCERQGVKF